MCECYSLLNAKIKKIYELIHTVSQTDTTVMIRGESGTGKELVAKAIHINSKRKYFPIIPVNCGALAESILESELFGHEKGAFAFELRTSKCTFFVNQSSKANYSVTKKVHLLVRSSNAKANSKWQ